MHYTPSSLLSATKWRQLVPDAHGWTWCFSESDCRHQLVPFPCSMLLPPRVEDVFLQEADALTPKSSSTFLSKGTVLYVHCAYQQHGTLLQFPASLGEFHEQPNQDVSRTGCECEFGTNSTNQCHGSCQLPVVGHGWLPYSGCCSVFGCITT